MHYNQIVLTHAQYIIHITILSYGKGEPSYYSVVKFSSFSIIFVTVKNSES